MKDKVKALQMMLDRQRNPMITYEMISEKTGYGRKQLGRLATELKEKDMSSILTHGNTGRKPVTTASDQEVSYLREMKKSYPAITITQFRDIFIEDVIEILICKMIYTSTALSHGAFHGSVNCLSVKTGNPQPTDQYVEMELM